MIDGRRNQQLSLKFDTIDQRIRYVRIVNQKPERVALQVIAAICDIFSCGPEVLITVTCPDCGHHRLLLPGPPTRDARS